MSQPAFSGVITAIATPFTAQGDIDESAFRRLLKMQKQARISGVVVSGTTGESPTLSDEEVTKLLEIALEERTNTFHVYVGTGSNDTRTTVAKTEKFGRFKSREGVSPDGVMVVVPYYNKPTQLGLSVHFSSILGAVPDLKVCLYNVPGRTATSLAPSTVLKLCRDFHNIAAIKEASGDLRLVSELRIGLDGMNLSDRIQLMSGEDLTYAPALLAGATGVISVTSHLIPWAMIDILKAARANDLHKVSMLHRAALPINRDLFVVGSPAPLKWALEHLGVCGGGLRAPLAPIEEAEIVIVKAALQKARDAGIRLASA